MTFFSNDHMHRPTQEQIDDRGLCRLCSELGGACFDYNGEKIICCSPECEEEIKKALGVSI